MIPLITLEDYKNSYPNSSLDDNEIMKSIDEASNVVNDLIKYQITSIDDITNAFVADKIKKAAIAQTHFFVQRGGFTFYLSSKIDSDFDSVSIGSFSMSKKSSGSNATMTDNNSVLENNGISPIAYRLLQQTGLMYAGVSTYGY